MVVILLATLGLSDSNTFGREVVYFNFMDKILNLITIFYHLTVH